MWYWTLRMLIEDSMNQVSFRSTCGLNKLLSDSWIGNEMTILILSLSCLARLSPDLATQKKISSRSGSALKEWWSIQFSHKLKKFRAGPKFYKVFKTILKIWCLDRSGPTLKKRVSGKLKKFKVGSKLTVADLG